MLFVTARAHFPTPDLYRHRHTSGVVITARCTTMNTRKLDANEYPTLSASAVSDHTNATKSINRLPGSAGITHSNGLRRMETAPFFPPTKPPPPPPPSGTLPDDVRDRRPSSLARPSSPPRPPWGGVERRQKRS
jgi:hypothetical protein